MSQLIAKQITLNQPLLVGRCWRYVETELRRGNAYLLPLRFFIGLGWLRASMEKLGDQAWLNGDALLDFLQTQMASGAVSFPFYQSLITQLFEPHAFLLSWIIMLGELCAGLAILTGMLTNLALLGGLFMNLNFVLVGVVNPSAFYIVIQGVLLFSNVGSTLGVDALISRVVSSFYIAAQPNFDQHRNAIETWSFLVLATASWFMALLVIPFIRDFGPNSVDDPAMLLCILLALGGLLLFIMFMRTLNRHAPDASYAQVTHVAKTRAQRVASQPSAEARAISLPNRQFIYPTLLVVLYAAWSGYMTWSGHWQLFAEYWPVSLTMTLGSFVAGATAEGGAAIAFPIFTKVLHIGAADARTFGLMIQAVGMTMAGVVILITRVKILPQVIFWVSLGGLLGQVIGTFWLTIPAPYPKILFTFTATVFGIALIISRWGLQWQPRAVMPRWTPREEAIFWAIGICGGAFASVTGSGIDMLTFIVLTLAFGIDEKISTPTTVIIMALNSIVGFALHGFILQDIGIAWNYWLVAVPIVVIGAPLGALVATRIQRDHIILFLLSLIGLELVSTVLLVPFSPRAITITTTAVIICSICFWLMLHYRQRTIKHPPSNGDTSLPPANLPPCHLPPATYLRCDRCQQAQNAQHGDCIWCGTSLAFGRPVQPDVPA